MWFSPHAMIAAMDIGVSAPCLWFALRFLCRLVGIDLDSCVDNIINWTCPLRFMIITDVMSFLRPWGAAECCAVSTSFSAHPV